MIANHPGGALTAEQLTLAKRVTKMAGLGCTFRCSIPGGTGRTTIGPAGAASEFK